METGLAGKRVLVTGGGGGIGSACVRAFAAEDARVAIHYRTSADRAEELAGETGGVALQADLTVEDEVDRLFEAAERELGGAVAAREVVDSHTRALGGECAHARRADPAPAAGHEDALPGQSRLHGLTLSSPPCAST